MQFITGNDHQQTYFSTLEDQVAADNAVRIIDAFVDKLDLQKMGFKNLKEALPGILPAAKIMEKVVLMITKNQTIQMGKGTIVSFAKNNRTAQPKTIFCTRPFRGGRRTQNLLCHLY
jgi:hypothetical protein